MTEQDDYQAMLAWKQRALAAETMLANTCNTISFALDDEDWKGVYKAWREAADFILKDKHDLIANKLKQVIALNDE